MKKLFAIALLSLMAAACEPATDNNSNSNNGKPNTATSTPAPLAPSPEASAPAKPQLKAGDKVKVTINGIATDATVVTLDEKAGKVTVKVEGQKEEKTVALSDIVK
jgi:protein involved in polysaccharide export with SLBB domain